MTTLETFTALSALWLAICWLPYILDRVITRGLPGALANYSADAKPQSDWAQRAMRAHQVGVESFVCFAPLALMAMIKMPEDAYPGILATSYFCGLFAHFWIYLFGIPVLRTLAFVVVVLSTVAMALRLFGMI
jgi:uncharacterized MAPEG superfamily protein